MKKHSIVALILLCVIFATWMLSMPLTASAADNNPRIGDSYDRLSDSDELRINEAIKVAEQAVNAVFLVDIYDIGDTFIPKLGNRVVESFGFSTKNNIVLLEIFYQYDQFAIFEDRLLIINYYMYTYGLPNRQITDSEVDAILDNENVYTNLKSGNYADGIVAFIEETVKAMPGREMSNETRLAVSVFVVGGIAMMIIMEHDRRKFGFYNKDGTTSRAGSSFSSSGGFGGGGRGGR